MLREIGEIMAEADVRFHRPGERETYFFDESYLSL